MRADADADAAPRAASADANARVVGADASDARDARNDAVRGRDVEGDVDRARDGDAPTVSSVVDALVKHHLAEREGKRTSRMPSHEFWETQPVRQFGEDTSRGAELREGPIDPPKLASETSESGGALPPGYEWCSCDMTDSRTQEEVYELLTNNYVEDDDAMFRFQYSQEFLKWALRPPEYHGDWHVGVRLKVTQTLVAFITGVPAKLRVKGKEIDLAEINFLCIHKKLRSKRIAPTLIKERLRDGSTRKMCGKRRTPRECCCRSRYRKRVIGIGVWILKSSSTSDSRAWVATPRCHARCRCSSLPRSQNRKGCVT